MLNRRLVFIAAALVSLWLIWPALRPTPPAPPLSLPDGQLQLSGHRIIPLQPFSLEARVLGREDYYLDRPAQLSPTDLALGWGPMAEPANYQRVAISQRNRWYYWRVDEFFIPRRDIERHSANMHMIPANPVVAKTRARVKREQRISLHGQLVRVEGDDGFRWVSSLSRDDTGDGACEVIWLEHLEILP